MTWLVKLLGVDKVRQAFARLAGTVDALNVAFREAGEKMAGKPLALPLKGNAKKEEES